jgi:hypothetical protein
MPFSSQGALHNNFRISYEMWATHWATCGEGHDAEAQGALVLLWLTQASAAVQTAQNRLTRKLVEMLLSVNPGRCHRFQSFTGGKNLSHSSDHLPAPA